MEEKDYNLYLNLTKSYLYLNRFRGDAYDELVLRLDEAMNNINKEILRTDEFTLITKNVIKEEITKAYSDYDTLVQTDIDELTEVAWDSTQSVFKDLAIAKGLEIATPKWENAKKSTKKKLLDKNRPILGNSLKDNKADFIFSNSKKLRQVIADGFESDLSIPVAQRRALAIKNADEAMASIKRRDLNTTVRTVLLNAVEETRQESFKQFEDEEWFKGYRYDAVMDNRTSVYCANANGYITKDISKAKYKIKSHYNCRSTWVPVTKWDDEFPQKKPVNQWDKRTVNHRDGTKSTKFKVGKTELVNANRSFESVFKTFDAQYQKDYLGATRYKLWKDGKATLKQMSDVAKNRFIPLDELRSKLNIKD